MMPSLVLAGGRLFALSEKGILTCLDPATGEYTIAVGDMERPNGGPWQRAGVSLSLPLTIQFNEGASVVHLNAGVAKPREQHRVWTGVIAGEHEVWRRTWLFAEIARDGDGRLGWSDCLSRRAHRQRSTRARARPRDRRAAPGPVPGSV